MVQEIQSVAKKKVQTSKQCTREHVIVMSRRRLLPSTDHAIHLLQGKVLIPYNLDNTNILLVEEMQCIYAKLKHLHSPTVITPEIYQYFLEPH